MKVKDIFKKCDTIPAKNLSDVINNIVDTFKKSLNDGVIAPNGLVKAYMERLKEIDKCFKTCILRNEHAKSGIYVSQHKGYAIATAMKEYYNFSISPKNLRMNYSYERL